MKKVKLKESKTRMDIVFVTVIYTTIIRFDIISYYYMVKVYLGQFIFFDVSFPVIGND